MQHAIAAVSIPRGSRQTFRKAPAAFLAKRTKWTEGAVAACSVAMLIASVVQFRGLDTARLFQSLPASLPFWIAFAGYYLASPVTDWVILRRLWAIPVSGFAGLLGKVIGNELVLSYLGDAYFYAWSRRNLTWISEPFGTLKDLAIISALVGSTVTLVALLLTWPLLADTAWGVGRSPLLLGACIALACGGIVVALGKRLISLPLPSLAFAASAHCVRALAQIALAIAMWHFALPSVPITDWVLLSALRLVVLRLPLVPNKDVIFAGIAVAIVGPQSAIAPVLAMIAGSIVLVHLIVGGSLFAAVALASGRAKMAAASYPGARFPWARSLSAALASTALATCGSPSRYASGDPSNKTAGQARPAPVSAGDARKLAAAEPFEMLTESAATAAPADLDRLIAAALAAEKSVHASISPAALVAVNENLGALTYARRMMNRADIALASVETYRALVTDLSGEGAVPTAVNLLDYCGFRYRASLAATPVRWSDMATSVAIAQAEWAPLASQIQDAGLRARFTQVLRDMNAATGQRDAGLARTSSQAELDMVDELERQFPAPKPQGSPRAI